MGWETRRGGRFYYRKRRVGRRVVSIYIGGGDAGRAAATQDARRRAEREAAQADRQAERAAQINRERETAAWSDAVELLAEAVLLGAGYRLDRGKWKRSRPCEP
jgi:hypothetical protein